LAFDEVRRVAGDGTGDGFAPVASGDGVFLVVDSGSSSPGAGVDDFVDFFFFVAEDDEDLELVALAVVSSSSSLEESAGAGFGVDLRAWELPDFFFDSAPAAIRTKLKKRTRRVRASRVME
jgi:hypothetical protein